VLKIEITSANPPEMLLRLAGNISEDHLADLVRLFEEAHRSGRRIGLDLDAVTLADRASVSFLTGCGAQFVRCPGFLREWIRGETEQRARANELETCRGLGSRKAAPEGQGEQP